MKKIKTNFLKTTNKQKAPKKMRQGDGDRAYAFFSLLQDLSSMARIKPRAGKHQGLPNGLLENSQNTTFKTRFRTKTG